MATIRDIVTRSLKLLEVVGAGETPSADEANDGLNALITMLDSWSIEGNKDIPLFDFSSIDNDFIAPMGWERAIIYNLAMEIAPEYGKEVPLSVSAIATESKTALEQFLASQDPVKLSYDELLLYDEKYPILNLETMQ